MKNSSLSGRMVKFMESSSWIRKMFEEGARLKKEHGAEKVCDFSLGNPDLPPPEAFQKALERAAADRSPGVHSYMPNAGIPWVRDKIAVQVERDHGVKLTGDDIIMTCGAAGGLNIIFKAILNPGEEVIVPRPFFVEYHFYTDNHQGKLVPVGCREDFSLDINAIRDAINKETKAVLVNSPNNPSGAIYQEDSIKELAELLADIEQEKGQTIYLISDEPYRKLVFAGNSCPPLMRHYRNTIVTTSFSKDLSIPGERIGYVAVHPEIRDRAALSGALNLANRILGFVNAPALMQRVVAEIASENVDTSIYERRRDLFAEILTRAGLSFTLPRGAFYFFPKSPTEDETGFVRILQEELILTVPGSGFGLPGHFRIAFCVDEEVIKRSEPGFKRAMERSAS